MKKILASIFLFVIFISCSSALCAQGPALSREQIRKNFEKRLNLSDKQKEKAKEIHKIGFDKMKVVMYEREMKRHEIEKIKASNLPEAQKEEKITALNAEIKNIDQKAHEIRIENSKEFEKILNKKQRNELEQMKAEGRANFEKKHPPRMPFGYFNSSGFWESKRLFPPSVPVPPSEFSK